MTDIRIPESTLRDVVAAQLATKFTDPEIVQAFVTSLLETRVDSMGRMSVRTSDPTMVQWTIERVVRQFVEETAKAWLVEHRDELVSKVGNALKDADVVQRLAEESAANVRLR